MVGPEARAGLRSPLDRAAAHGHADAVLHMAALDLQSRTLLTCGRDGVVKAWQ